MSPFLIYSSISHIQPVNDKNMSHEAERANVPLTLMIFDELILALLEYYKDLNMDIKQMVPLKRLYWSI